MKNVYEIESLNTEYLFFIICLTGIRWLVPPIEEKEWGENSSTNTVFCEEGDIWFMIVLELV